MNDNHDEIICPSCGAENLASNVECWQCRQPLRMRPGQNASVEPQVETEAPVPAPDDQRVGARSDTQTHVVLGYVLAAISLVICPMLGIASIVLGAIAYVRGDRRGIWVIVAGAVGFTAGSIISISLLVKFMESQSVPN